MKKYMAAAVLITIVLSVNGQDYWEYAAQNDEDQEKMMIFTAQGVDITSADRAAGGSSSDGSGS